MPLKSIPCKPIFLLAAATLVGCGGATTETGYQPKRLGMSGGEVRSLYAPAFSPDSHPTDNSGAPSGLSSHRPGS
jgi:hypothetical protein